MQVVDSKKNEHCLGTLSYPIKNLLTAKDMTVNSQFSLKDSLPEAKLHVRLCLRVSMTSLVRVLLTYRTHSANLYESFTHDSSVSVMMRSFMTVL